MKIFHGQIWNLEMFFGHVTLCKRERERERNFFILKIKLERPVLICIQYNALW